jgi:hypothetical protein
VFPPELQRPSRRWAEQPSGNNLLLERTRTRRRPLRRLGTAGTVRRRGDDVLRPRPIARPLGIDLTALEQSVRTVRVGACWLTAAVTPVEAGATYVPIGARSRRSAVVVRWRSSVSCVYTPNVSACPHTGELLDQGPQDGERGRSSLRRTTRPVNPVVGVLGSAPRRRCRRRRRLHRGAGGVARRVFLTCSTPPRRRPSAPIEQRPGRPSDASDQSSLRGKNGQPGWFGW